MTAHSRYAINNNQYRLPTNQRSPLWEVRFGHRHSQMWWRNLGWATLPV